NQYAGNRQELEGFNRSERRSLFLDRRGVRQKETINGKDQRDDARDRKRAGESRFHVRTRLERSQGRVDPGEEADVSHRGDFGPIDRDKNERPARGNPADGAPDSDIPEVLLRVLKIRESDRVGKRESWNKEEAVNQHERQEGEKR